MARRAVRRLFSRPKKGYRTYGKNKHWRGSICNLDNAKVTHNLKQNETLHTFSQCQVELIDCMLYPSLKEVYSVKHPVKVLSLFDGISTGLFILNKLGLHVGKYFASEIDSDAICVSKYHYFDKIINVGCVKALTNSEVDALGEINLLIGGSPCTELSLVNPRRKGINDPDSSGSLFYEYERILKFLREKAEQNNTQFHWLFENTFSMEVSTCNTISSLLGPSSVHCASKFVPMKRKRRFWGSIPKMHEERREVINKPKLQDFLKPYRLAAVTCVPTLTSNRASQRSAGRSGLLPVLEDGQEKHLTVNEMELLFGFTEHYTQCGDLSTTSKRKLLGKAWSVHVVLSILSPLKDLYACNNIEI